MKHAAFVLLLWAVSCGAAASSVYKWVDEQGRVHYGDRPKMPDSEEIRIESADSPAAGAALSEDERRERRRRLLEAFEQERAERKAAAEKKRENKQLRERRCAVATDRLRSIREAGALYEVDAAGERRYFSDEERRNATSRAAADVKKWCG